MNFFTADSGIHFYKSFTLNSLEFRIKILTKWHLKREIKVLIEVRGFMLGMILWLA